MVAGDGRVGWVMVGVEGVEGVVGDGAVVGRSGDDGVGGEGYGREFLRVEGVVGCVGGDRGGVVGGGGIAASVVDGGVQLDEKWLVGVEG